MTQPAFSWPLALVGVGGVLVVGKLAQQSGWLDDIERAIRSDDSWRLTMLVYAGVVAAVFYAASKNPEMRPAALTWFVF